MFKRKLFKRALPVILSVAMIFQSTPATALAAENVETEAIVETSEGAEPSGDSSDAGSTDSSEPSEVSPASEDAPTADGNSEEQANEEQANEEQESKENGTETQNTEEVKADEAKTEETKEESTSTEASQTEETTSEAVSGNEGTAVPEETTEAVVEATDEIEADGEAKDVNAEEAALETTIIVKDALKSQLEGLSGVQQDKDAAELTYKSPYSGTANTYRNMISEIENNLSYYLGVEIDGKENTNLPQALKVEWQKKAVDKDEWAHVDTYPTEVGNYRLLITLEEVSGLCKNAETSVYVTIEQAELTVDVSEIVATPGTTVEAFKAQVAEECILKNASAYDEIITKETFVKNITVTVMNAYDKSELKNSADDGTVNKLTKDGDYVMTIAVELLDNVAANYAVVESDKVYDITVADLVETNVIVTKKDDGKEITTVYNGNVIDESLVKDAVESVKVVYADDEEKIVSFQDEQLTLAWYIKKIDLTDTSGESVSYEELAEVPKDAGEYYVKYIYAGEPNIYKKSESDPIKVTIEPVSLVLRPEKTPELKAGMTLDEVRKQLAEIGYKLYEVKVDADGKETETEYTAAGKEFWGVSYKDKETTEYYTPVFRLECREAEKDEEGNLVKQDDKVQYGEWKPCEEALSELEELRETSEEIQYRLIFSGKKAVFKPDGSTEGKEVDITDTTTMGAEKNYLVRADEETLNNTALEVTVGTAIATEIDVTEIIKAFNGKTDFTEQEKALGTDENPLWKIYDAVPLFTSRDDYKKAVVKPSKVGDTDPNCKDTAEQLSYHWYRQDGDEWVELPDLVVTGVDETLFFNAITNVNTYKLEVRYEDPNHTFLSATKDVVFEIRKQEIVLVGEDLTARAGKKSDDITGSYWIYAIPNNDEEAFWKLSEEDKKKCVISEAILFGEDADHYDIQKKYLKSFVERQEMDAQGNPKPDSYVPMGVNETFMAGYKYRAYLYFDFESNYMRSNFTNIDRSAMAAAVAAEEETGTIYHHSWSDVTVKTIGSEELELIVDETKLPKSYVYGDAVTIADVQTAFESGLFQIVLKNDHAQVVKPEELFGVDAEGKPDYASGKLGYYFAYPDSSASDGYAYTQMAVNARTYYLNVMFEGNETYADFDIIFRGNNSYPEYSFEITKRPLTITPIVSEEEISAGEPVNTISDRDTTPFTVEGAAVLAINGVTILDDTRYFTYGAYEYENGSTIIGYPALYTYNPNVIETGETYLFTPTYKVGNIQVQGYEYLRYGRTYQVSFNNTLNALFANNYEVTYASTPYEVKVRANAKVAPIGYDTIEFTRLDANISEAGASQTIVPREGIPFVYDVALDGEEELLDGNFFAFRISAPKEFATRTQFAPDGEFIYENSIKAAGGYILSTGTYYESEAGFNNKYIDVAFNVTDLKGSKKEFSIRWEDGYVEKFTVDFTDVELEADLREAVAPKSLAFNGINSKMAVGEEQALDVKVTKVQLGDIISIGYRTVPEDSDIISIDPKSGVVTALKANPKPVEIQAYAYRLVDGKEEEFPKPVAKAKITVTDVTAPAIKKVDQIRDNGARIQYTKVDNGYRRELYVLEGKNVSVSTFEAEIQKLENGQATNLVMAPIYNVENTSVWDEKAKVYQYQVELNNFKTEQDYSVYLRNVSAVRTLENGAKVEKSAKGTVKSFKTTKNQVRMLIPFFDETKTKVEAVLDEDGNLDFFDAKLLDKSAQLSVYGYYKDVDSTAAEDRDLLEFLLPVAKNQPNYLNPKLSYYVFDYYGDYSDEEYVDGLSEGWLKQSTYAAVNNKGKVTLKGVDLNGAKKVRLVVVSDNEVYGGCTLRITAVPDAVKGKNVKAKIGDPINLWNCLDYTEYKKKVPNYRSSRLVIENKEDAKDAGFIITDPYYDEDGVYHTYGIVATKQAKNFELKIKDTIIYINGDTNEIESDELQTSIKITVNALDAVKGLKTSYIDDKHITLNFTHAGNPSDFLIEVKDGRGNIVSRKLIANNPRSVSLIYEAEPQYRQNKQQHIVDRLTYFVKTKTYAYTIDDPKLVRLSAYTITVTAMYGTTASKAAVKKVKTTNIPASYENMAVWPDNTYGGEDIYVTRKDGWLLEEDPFLTSGNTYTLIMDSNDIPMTRVTDTLTWKSSDPKVATVKANPGTYSATLKAVKAGETKIEVTSKITKKVIARYLVCVKPVSGGSSYLGEYEQGWFRQWDPLYTGTVEVLTLSNKVVVEGKKSNDRTWVSFTAPAFGQYTFRNNGYNGMSIYDQKNGESVYRYTPVILESGQQIYFKVYGNFTLTAEGTEFAKLTTEAPVHVAKETWVSFVAPEDNYYTFAVDNGSIASVRLNDENQGSYGREYKVSLKAGDTVLLKTSAACAVSVVRREVVAALDTTGNKADTTLTKDITERWMTYKALATGWYTFKVTGTDDVTYYKGLDSTELADVEPVVDSPVTQAFNVLAAALASVQADETQDPIRTKTVRIWLSAGETLAIKIALGNVELGENDECKVSVEVTLPKFDELTMEKPLDVKVAENSDAAWVSFTIPSEGSYSFKAADKDGNPVGITYYNENYQEIAYSYASEYILVVPYENDIDGKKVLINAKDTIYLKVESDAQLSVSEISNSATALTAGKAQSVEISSDGKYWYTFKAPQDGDYVFRMDANIPGANASTSLTSLTAQLYNQVGKDYIRGFYIINSSESMHLAANETVTFCLKATDVSADSKITGYLYVDSNVAATAITTAGVEVSIDNAKDKAGTSKWYSFTAAAKGDYQFTWKPAEGSGDARIELYDNVVNGSWLGMMNNNNTNVNVERNSGAVTYIKVIQTTDTAVKGNLAVAPVTVEKLVSGEAKQNVKVTGAQSKYYTFIAPKKAKYVITSTVAEKDASVYLHWSDSDGTSYIGSSYYETDVIEAGTVCTLEVATSNETATVNLLVTALEPKAIAADGTMESANGVPGWYAYQVTEPGRYSLGYVPAENNQIGVAFYNDDYEALQGDMQSRYCEAGTIYVKATAYASETQKAAFKAEKLTVKPLSNQENIKIDANGKAYYEYKVETDGTYIFTTKAAENKAVADSITYAVNMGNTYRTLYTNYAYNTESGSFKKGDKLFIRMESGAGAEFTLTVEQKAIDLKADVASDEITLQAGEQAYFNFKAYESGKFVFKTSEVTEGASLSATTSNGWLKQISQHKGFYVVSKDADINSTISFTVRNNGSEDVKFKVLAERVEPTIIETTAKITVNKNEMQWLTFKVPEDGRYIISSSNEEMELQRWVKYNSSESMQSMSSEIVLYEDTELTFVVIYNGEKDTETTDISIAPVEVKAITGSGDTTITLESGASQWLSYTADKMADYTFSLKSGEVDEYMELYRAITNNYNSGYGNMFTQFMEPEGTVYFRLTNGGEEKKDYVFTVSVRERKVIQLEEGALSEEVTLKYGEEAHFVFEPGNNYGQFIFKTPGLQSNVRLSATREDHDGDYEWNQEFYGYNGFYVVANTPNSDDRKIEFVVRSYSEMETSFSVLTERLVSTSVAVGTSQVQLEQNEPKWLYFSAPEDGRYSLYASCGEEDAVSLAWSLDDIGEINRISSYGLNAGYGIQVVVCYYGEAAQVTANITVEKDDIELTPITNDETFTMEPYGSKWFSYTAEEDMECSFSLNCYEGYGELYLGVYNSLTDNYNLNNWDRSITDSYSTRMTAGQTLYFRVRNYDEDTHECSFVVTTKTYNAVLNQSLQFEQYGDVKWITYTAEEDGEYEIIGYTPDYGDFYVEYYRGEDTEDYEGRMNVYSSKNNISMPLTMKSGDKVRIKVHSWAYAVGNEEDPEAPYSHSISITIAKVNMN